MVRGHVHVVYVQCVQSVCSARLERVEDTLVAALELEKELAERVEGHLLEVELAPSAQPHRAPLGVVLDRKDDVLVGVAVDL